MDDDALLSVYGAQTDTENSIDNPHTKPSFASNVKNFFRIANPILALYLFLLVVVGTADVVGFAIAAKSIPHYPLVFHQVIIISYIPTFGAIVFYKLKFTNDIPSSMTTFPKKRFAMMGLLDTGATILSVFGSINTPNPLQPLLRQLVIITTMVASFFFLKVSYRWSHGVGVLFIIVGVLLCVVFQFDFSGEDVSLILYSSAFALAAVPAAIGSVYKEFALKAVEMDVCYLNYWIAVFQFCFGWSALLIVPLLPDGPSWSDLPMHVIDGFAFFFTSSALIFGSIYIGLNIIYNILILVVMKHGSSTVMYAASTLTVPLSLLLFAAPFLAQFQEGSDTGLKWYFFAGGALVTVGLMFYKYQDEVQNTKAAPSSKEENVELLSEA